MILFIKDEEIWMLLWTNRVDYIKNKWKSKIWWCTIKLWKKLSSRTYTKINVPMGKKSSRKSVMQKKKKCKLKKCSTIKTTNIQPKQLWSNPWSSNNKKKLGWRRTNNYKIRKWEPDKWCMRRWPEKRDKDWSMKTMFKRWSRKSLNWFKD